MSRIGKRTELNKMQRGLIDACIEMAFKLIKRREIKSAQSWMASALQMLKAK